MKYYNCKNTHGFDIDGKMDEQENGFDKGYCLWDMVTGSSGTYFRTWDPHFKLADLDIPIEEVIEPWYYDDDTPDHYNNRTGAPVFQNGWNMCSGLVNVIFKAALALARSLLGISFVLLCCCCCLVFIEK